MSPMTSTVLTFKKIQVRYVSLEQLGFRRPSAAKTLGWMVGILPVRKITSSEDDQNKQKVFGSIDGDEFSVIFIDSDRIHRWSH